MQMKSILRLLSLIALFAVLGSGVSHAGGGSKEKATFYSKATATAVPTGSGKVYISANTAAGSNIEYKESMELPYSREDEGDTAPTKATHTYYFYAQPEEGYIFNRWMLVNNTTGKTSQASLVTPYSRNVSTTAASEDAVGTSTALVQLQAEFIPTPPIQVAAGNLASYSTTSISNKANKVGDKVTLKAGRQTMGTGMGTLNMGRSVVFDGWYNKANELVSTDETFEYTIPEDCKDELFTANYKFVPLIHGDGYYRVRWTYSEQYWTVTGNYDPTPSMFTNHDSRKIDGVLDLTERSDYSCPGSIIKMTADSYNITDDFKNNVTVANNIVLEAQGTSTRSILSKYTINIQSGEFTGNYKLMSSSGTKVQIASNEHGSNDLGYLYVRPDYTGNISTDADAYFDFEPIDEAHVDRFYYGAKADAVMYFDGGYWVSMYTSFPYYLYDEGMEAYYVPEIMQENGEAVALLEKIEGGKVPAYTAVLLKCPGTTAIENRMIPSMEEYPALETNLLKGEFQLNKSKSDTNKAKADSSKRVLSCNSDNTVGFYKLADGTELAANRAYLDVSSVPAAQRSNIRIATSRSGLNSLIMESQSPAPAAIYDIYGRKVTEMKPGNIYLVNGKKVLYN